MKRVVGAHLGLESILSTIYHHILSLSLINYHKNHILSHSKSIIFVCLGSWLVSPGYPHWISVVGPVVAQVQEATRLAEGLRETILCASHGLVVENMWNTDGNHSVGLPSGKRSHHHVKPPFFMGKSMN